MDPIKITVEPADDGRNVKCPRCWHWHSVTSNFDNLCDECQKIILEYYPEHPAFAGIKAALEKWSKPCSPS